MIEEADRNKAVQSPSVEIGGNATLQWRLRDRSRREETVDILA